MGKRKSRKIQAKAAAPKCDTVLDCPYCSHRQTIEVQLLRKDGLGKLFCRICGYKYQKRLGPLDKQVDIYCAMIDDAEALNTKKQKDGIGFLARDEYDDEALNGDEDDFATGTPAKIEAENIL
jgi:transcription elongation factor Elf1